jgi:uncharacterized C2H2 Zn-finger protein
MAYCPRCDRYFRNEDALWQHKRDSGNHWTCYECNKDFSTESALNQHYVQSPLHSYCQRCDELFEDDDELEEHYEESHWYCRPCNKVCIHRCLGVLLALKADGRSLIPSADFRSTTDRCISTASPVTDTSSPKRTSTVISARTCICLVP